MITISRTKESNMLVKRTFETRRKRNGKPDLMICWVGYFLLGVIPLYVYQSGSRPE